MTLKQSRTTQLRCDCGFVTALTTASMAEYSLRRHSCAKQRTRDARRQRRLDRLAESGPERPCQHNDRHPHGDRVRYVIDKCRCRPCRDAASQYARDLNRRHMYGKTTYVPADKARQHVRSLQAQGMGWKRVADAAGLTESVVWKMLYGDPARGMAPSKRIRPATEAKILAVELDIAPGMNVAPTGTTRRLQALVAIGWSVGQISRRSGLDRQCLDAAIHGNGITARTRDTVSDVYDLLWSARPPQSNRGERVAVSRSRNRAAAHGWAPPLAWDDDAIDDPAAQPDLGANVSTTGGKRIHVEDIEFLLEDNPMATARRIADRLHCGRDAIQQACRRAGRTDLLQQLARNAELEAAA